MAKSGAVDAVDQIQRRLRPALKGLGFKVRGRTFNRVTEDGLTQVINLQLGLYDPSEIHIPGLRENRYGKFTVNLGVYVPEVERYLVGRAPGSFVQEYSCCIRSRLGQVAGRKRDLWWEARVEDDVVDDVAGKLTKYGLPFLERYSTRDKLLAELEGRARHEHVDRPARIVSAMIYFARGEKKTARRLLEAQIKGANKSEHADYIRELIAEVGLE